MCTRFVCNGEDTITGFNFDIDLSVWTHQVVKEKDRFFIGIRMPDHQYHSFHGVNKNGNVGTLLYVNGNERGAYCPDQKSYTISRLTETFIQGHISLDDAIHIVETEKIVYAPDATMQAMLSDQNGRVLIIEPGIGYRIEEKKYSLITNYSVISPETTRPYIVPGDDRYERAKQWLDRQQGEVTVKNALELLEYVKQEGIWATRVSFVYSVKENIVYYILDRDFERVREYGF